MKKITPVLIVETIEKNLPFWCERLGFARQVEVPHGDRLGTRRGTRSCSRRRRGSRPEATGACRR